MKSNNPPAGALVHEIMRLKQLIKNRKIHLEHLKREQAQDPIESRSYQRMKEIQELETIIEQEEKRMKEYQKNLEQSNQQTLI